jgi:hypothetical protein
MERTSRERWSVAIGIASAIEYIIAKALIYLIQSYGDAPVGKPLNYTSLSRHRSWWTLAMTRIELAPFFSRTGGMPRTVMVTEQSKITS